jgi:sulfite exporter TauE/SafE
MNILLFAFITGLTTGGISCLAVQGGLLVSSLSPSGEGKQRNRWMLISFFLISKLVAYTFLGYILGSIGSVITISSRISGMFQLIAGIFMIVTAFQILNIHPMFRYFVLTPDKRIFRLVREQSKTISFVTPMILGFLTIFLPCGVTQAMMVTAIGSGNGVTGAAILFAFILGTSPVFFALGASFLELFKRKVFVYVAAGILILFGILSMNGGLGIIGSIYTIQNFYRAATTDFFTLSGQPGLAPLQNGVQEVTVEAGNWGYTATATKLKVGIPVRLTITTHNTWSCSRAFVIPGIQYYKILPETGSEVVEFTPERTGSFTYTCSMGMYTGVFTVIP